MTEEVAPTLGMTKQMPLTNSNTATNAARMGFVFRQGRTSAFANEQCLG
jgi:hypothetical protein